MSTYQGNSGLANSAGQIVRNSVLRNTFILLALSMVPTVLGAWIGLETGVMSYFRGGLGFIGIIAVMFVFIFAIEKNKNSAMGVPLLLGFTFFMGLVMSSLLSLVLSKSDGAQIVMTAFGSTAAVFAGMSFLAFTIKKDLTSWGPILFAAVIGLLVASVVNIFIGSTVVMMAISGIATVVFSLFLLFDLKRIVDGGETNYISATLAVYLDLVNIFQNILVLLGLGSSRD